MKKISMYDFAKSIFNSHKRSGYFKNFLDENSVEEFDTIIKSDELSSKLVRSIIDSQLQNDANSSEPIQFNKYRSPHILITWLVGLGLSRKLKIINLCSGMCKVYFNSIWLILASIHDYGYFCSETKNEEVTINTITDKYDLLTDAYEEERLSTLNDFRTKYGDYFSYDYDEIKNYYQYRAEKPKENNKFEKNDHGIVGGCLAFGRYCKNIIKSKIGPSDIMTQIIKIACFNTASHNIFKSQSINDDIIYRKYNLNNLLSNSPVRVKKENPFLLLMSLVDTIEATKHFSKKENDGFFIERKTLLSKIFFIFSGNELVVDFTELQDHIKNSEHKDEKMECLKQHIKNIEKLKDWTDFNSKTNKRNILSVKISLSNETIKMANTCH